VGDRWVRRGKQWEWDGRWMMKIFGWVAGVSWVGG
jgi:hypothetical protein